MLGDSLAKSFEDLSAQHMSATPSLGGQSPGRSARLVGAHGPVPFTSASDTVTYRDVETHVPSTTLSVLLRRVRPGHPIHPRTLLIVVCIRNGGKTRNLCVCICEFVVVIITVIGRYSDYIGPG